MYEHEHIRMFLKNMILLRLDWSFRIILLNYSLHNLFEHNSLSVRMHIKAEKIIKRVLTTYNYFKKSQKSILS